MLHNLAIVDPNIEISSDYIDVSRRNPLCPGVRSVGVAERDVHTRYFFILQNVANDIFKSSIRSDGKFTDTITVLVTVSVVPKVLFKLLVIGAYLSQAVAFYSERQRGLFQIPELAA